MSSFTKLNPSHGCAVKLIEILLLIAKKCATLKLTCESNNFIQVQVWQPFIEYMKDVSLNQTDWVLVSLSFCSKKIHHVTI